MGFTCQQTSTGPVCCSGGNVIVGPDCPAGQNSLPQACTVGGINRGGCPPGYNCQTSQRTGQSICCGNFVQSYQCPAVGQVPLMDNGVVRQCQLNSPNCGVGYSCVQALNQPGVYICCSGTGGGCKCKCGPDRFRAA